MALLFEDAVFIQKVTNYLYNQREDAGKSKTCIFLGNPGCNLTYLTYNKLLEKLGISPHITIKEKTSDERIDIKDFFRSLGFQNLKSLDYSDYESADIIHNLNNLDLPKEHHSVANLIYDTGTLEHCFNIPNCFQNIHNLLKENGVIIHSNPVNGYVDHGLYQISPTLLHDYYLSNGYKIIGFAICPEVHYEYSKYYFKMEQYEEEIYWKNGYNNRSIYNTIPSKYPRAIVCFAAQKTNLSTCHTNIIQSWYRRVNNLEQWTYHTPVEFSYELKKAIPVPNFSFLKRLRNISFIKKFINENFDLYFPN